MSQRAIVESGPYRQLADAITDGKGVIGARSHSLLNVTSGHPYLGRAVPHGRRVRHLPHVALGRRRDRGDGAPRHRLGADLPQPQARDRLPQHLADPQPRRRRHGRSSGWRPAPRSALRRRPAGSSSTASVAVPARRTIRSEAGSPGPTFASGVVRSHDVRGVSNATSSSPARRAPRRLRGAVTSGRRVDPSRRSRRRPAP